MIYQVEEAHQEQFQLQIRQNCHQSYPQCTNTDRPQFCPVLACLSMKMNIYDNLDQQISVKGSLCYLLFDFIGATNGLHLFSIHPSLFCQLALFVCHFHEKGLL